jgi:hypothetical protein
MAEFCLLTYSGGGKEVPDSFTISSSVGAQALALRPDPRHETATVATLATTIVLDAGSLDAIDQRLSRLIK